MSLRHAPGREDDDVREADGEQTSSVAKHVLEKERDSDVDAQNQELKAFLGTTSFGKKEIERDLDAAYDHTKRNSNQVRQQKHTAAEDSDDSIEASSDDDEAQLPITHEIILKKHQRAVSALSLDPAGARLVSGSYDSQVTYWDFAGMGAERRSFKSVEPVETHHIHQTEFSNDGNLVLLVAANWQAKLLSREGEEKGEFVRGDPYLRELRNTKGHIGELTAGSWNQRIKGQCMTASADSTIRLWDVANIRKNLAVLVHRPRTSGQGKVKVTTAAFSQDSKIIGAAYFDGTLSLWTTDGPYHRPMGGTVLDAHKPGTETTGIAFSPDGYSFASRGYNCVKLWDMRTLKTHIAIQEDLPTTHTETNILYTPNNQHIFTPTATSTAAHIAILSAKTGSRTDSIPFKSPVVRVLFHSKINQVVAGCASGDIHVLYSPVHSTRGAKLVVGRAPKVRHVDDLETADVTASAVTGDIVLPSGMLDESIDDSFRSSGRIRNQDRRDPKKSHMPTMPSSSRGREKVMDLNDSLIGMRDEDPREALLKYDALAKKDPMFTGIYSKNQPQTILAESTGQNEGEELDPATRKPKRPKFG